MESSWFQNAFELSAPLLRSSEASLSCDIILTFNHQVSRDNSGEALKVHHPLSADWLIYDSDLLAFDLADYYIELYNVRTVMWWVKRGPDQYCSSALHLDNGHRVITIHSGWSAIGSQSDPLCKTGKGFSPTHWGRARSCFLRKFPAPYNLMPFSMVLWL